MKRIPALIFACVASLSLATFFAVLAQVSMTTITASSIKGYGGTLLARGIITFQPVDVNGQPISSAGVAGQSVSCYVVTGAITTAVAGGTCQAVDALAANPQVCYKVSLYDSITRRSIPTPGQTCAQPTGPSWSYDTFVPSSPSITPPSTGGTVAGPTTFNAPTTFSSDVYGISAAYTGPLTAASLNGVYDVAQVPGGDDPCFKGQALLNQAQAGAGRSFANSAGSYGCVAGLTVGASAAGTGSIAGTTLTITAGFGFAPGWFLYTNGSSAITPGTQIVSQTDGTPKGPGHYVVNNSQTVSSETLSGSSVAIAPDTPWGAPVTLNFTAPGTAVIGAPITVYSDNAKFTGLGAQANDQAPGTWFTFPTGYTGLGLDVGNGYHNPQEFKWEDIGMRSNATMPLLARIRSAFTPHLVRPKFDCAVGLDATTGGVHTGLLLDTTPGGGTVGYAEIDQFKSVGCGIGPDFEDSAVIADSNNGVNNADIVSSKAGIYAGHGTDLKFSEVNAAVSLASAPVTSIVWKKAGNNAQTSMVQINTNTRSPEIFTNATHLKLFTPVTTTNTTNGLVTFSGTGTLTAVSCGQYATSDTTPSTYDAVIDATGTPDTVTFKKNGVVVSSGVPITGACQHISPDGIGFQFSGTTGGALTDTWTVTPVVTFVPCGAYIGSDATPPTFTLTIQTATPPFTFEWQKNGGALTTGVVSDPSQCQVMSDGVGVQWAGTGGAIASDSYSFSVVGNDYTSLSGIPLVDGKLPVNYVEFVDADACSSGYCYAHVMHPMAAVAGQKFSVQGLTWLSNYTSGAINPNGVWVIDAVSSDYQTIYWWAPGAADLVCAGSCTGKVAIVPPQISGLTSTQLTIPALLPNLTGSDQTWTPGTVTPANSCTAGGIDLVNPQACVGTVATAIYLDGCQRCSIDKGLLEYVAGGASNRTPGSSEPFSAMSVAIWKTAYSGATDIKNGDVSNTDFPVLSQSNGHDGLTYASTGMWGQSLFRLSRIYIGDLGGYLEADPAAGFTKFQIASNTANVSQALVFYDPDGNKVFSMGRQMAQAWYNLQIGPPATITAGLYAGDGKRVIFKVDGVGAGTIPNGICGLFNDGSSATVAQIDCVSHKWEFPSGKEPRLLGVLSSGCNSTNSSGDIQAGCAASGITTGQLSAAHGGTGQDNSGATGISQWSGGVQSVSTALAAGTTAANQAVTDVSTKLATTALVCREIGTSVINLTGVTGAQTLASLTLPALGTASHVYVTLTTTGGASNGSLTSVTSFMGTTSVNGFGTVSNASKTWTLKWEIVGLNSTSSQEHIATSGLNGASMVSASAIDKAIDWSSAQTISVKGTPAASGDTQTGQFSALVCP